MEQYKRLRKGSIVYYKNYNDAGKMTFEVEDIFKNLNGVMMVCIKPLDSRALQPASEYYGLKRFNHLFKVSIIEILKKL